MQRNWIGRSTGAEVDFFIGTFLDDDGKPSQKEYQGWLADRAIAGWLRKPDEEVLRIYTTRPDTLFGATYMVIAPEHPFVERLTQPEQAAAVRDYCEKSARKSDLDRTDLAKEKTGVFTGSYAINPVNGEAIPIWIADYVLISYGTGAIMAVPAHDTRDFEFAKVFDLPIIPVVDPGAAADVPRDDLLAGRVAFIADGTVINSGPYNGLTTAEFKKKIVEDLDAKGFGRGAVNYKLRDWLFSRQHFWGEPFPILHELDDDGEPTGRIRALKPEDLPLDLPAEMKFDAAHDSPQPPLDKAPEDWLYVTLDGKKYKRETNTMPQWAGSCWYYLRFLDPKNDKALIDPEIEKAWMPVDLYVGGAEHAVLHLLYARFWHKVLYDRGYVSMAEPFQKLVNQGMILGENNEKMSKSRGNVVNPDHVVKEYGADSLAAVRNVHGSAGGREAVEHGRRERRAELFEPRVADDHRRPPRGNATAAVHQGRSAHGRAEPHVAQDHQGGDERLRAVVVQHGHRADDGVHEFLLQGRNPAESRRWRQFVLLLSPFAPHLAEELWEILGHKTTLAYEPWPTYDEAHAEGRHRRSAGADQRQAEGEDRRPDRQRRRRVGSARARAMRKSPSSSRARTS